jgi:uncharacterized protein (DUF2141 family)
MKAIGLLLLATLAVSCRETPPQSILPQGIPPRPPLGQIIAYVYWDNQGLPGKKLVLLETADTLFTDANGLAIFDVRAGHYVLRAFEINRGGPCCGSIDFGVDVQTGVTTKVSIFDCLPCL